MNQDVGYGGLKLPDLYTRVQVIHLKWIEHMWRNHDSLIAHILIEAFHGHEVNTLLLCKPNLANKVDKRYRFLSEILATWAKVHTCEPLSEEVVHEEVLWHNDYISAENKVLSWKCWWQAGIIRQ